MYESHFGLMRRPFLTTPDPDCFATAETMENALAGLQLCVETGQGFGILSAPAGTGKTLLCRKLVVDFRERFGTVFLAHSNFSTRRSLLQAILYELGHPYIRMAEQELRLELKSAVNAVRLEKEAVLLVIDEAHLLSNLLLEEVRTVANSDEGGIPLVRVVLSGQLLLEEKLTSPELEALNQRIACQVALESFTRSESIDYIAHRLHWAGGDIGDVFGADALEIISHAADGLPRCLNQLCDHALLLAYVADECPVKAATVREALEDLKQLPLHWNEPPPVSSPLEQLHMQAATSDVSGETIGEDLHESIAADSSHHENEAPLEGTIEIGTAIELPSDDWGAGTGESDGVIEIGVPDSLLNDQIEEFASVDCESTIVEVGLAESSADENHAAAASAGVIDFGPEESPLPEVQQHGVTVEAALHQSDAELIGMPSISLSSSPSERPIVSTDGFEEELVVDRYALLDSGRPISGQQIPVAANTNPIEISPSTTNSIARPQTSSETNSKLFDDATRFATVTFGDEMALIRTPDQLIDEIQPIISGALDSPLPLEDASLEAIAENIVDSQQEACDAGQKIGSGMTENSLRYDIVQPELTSPVADRPTSPIDRPTAGNSITATHVEGSQSRGRYAHLFSKLRRRQRTA